MGHIRTPLGGVYRYQRASVSLPYLSGHRGHVGIGQFVPSPLKRLPGINPLIQRTRGDIEPYVHRTQGGEYTFGVGVSPFKSRLQLFNHSYIPNVEGVGNFIAAPRKEDRETPPISNLGSQDGREIHTLAENENIEQVGAGVNRLAHEQKEAFFGKKTSFAQRVLGTAGRKGVLDPIEDLAVSTQSKGQGIKNLVKQGIEQGQECCIQNRESMKRIDRKLVQGVAGLNPFAEFSTVRRVSFVGMTVAVVSLGFIIFKITFDRFFVGKRKKGNKDYKIGF